MTRRRPAPPRPADTDGLWVRTDVMPTGQYGVVVTIGADHVWPLDRSRAQRYAADCITVATFAQHDAAVMGLLVDGTSMPTAEVLRMLRRTRPPRLEVLPGLALQPIYGAGSRTPIVQLVLDGELIGELTPRQVIDHAAAALATAAGAELDTRLRQVLLEDVGLDTVRAYAVVAELATYWPDPTAGAS